MEAAISMTHSGGWEFSSLEEWHRYWQRVDSRACHQLDSCAHDGSMINVLEAGVFESRIPADGISSRPAAEEMPSAYQQLSPLSSLGASLSPPTVSPESSTPGSSLNTAQNFYEAAQFAESSLAGGWTETQFGFGLQGLLTHQQAGYVQPVSPAMPHACGLLQDFSGDAVAQACGPSLPSTDNSLSEPGTQWPSVGAGPLSLFPSAPSGTAIEPCQSNLLGAWPGLDLVTPSVDCAEPVMTSIGNPPMDHAPVPTQTDPVIPLDAPAATECTGSSALTTTSDPLTRLPARERRKHEKPSKCPVPGCALGFQYPPGVKRHLISCHKDQAHLYGLSVAKLPCPHQGCGKLFARSDHVTRHMKQKHQGRGRGSWSID